MTGSVINVLHRAQESVELECLPSLTQNGRDITMCPLDKRYPRIAVSNHFSKQPEANKTFFIKIDTWMA